MVAQSHSFGKSSRSLKRKEENQGRKVSKAVFNIFFFCKAVSLKDQDRLLKFLAVQNFLILNRAGSANLLYIKIIIYSHLLFNL